MVVFRCPICRSETGYPLLNIKCGHTLCSECWKQLSSCKLCGKLFTNWMLIDNYILINEKTVERQLEKEEDEFLQLLKVRKQQQNVIAETYIEKTSEEIVDLVRRSILDDPIKCRFSYNIKADESFYSNLITRVANRIRQLLDIYNIDVKIDTPSYSTISDVPNYSHTVTVLLPVTS